jgi:hypothetical protein
LYLIILEAVFSTFYLKNAQKLQATHFFITGSSNKDGAKQLSNFCMNLARNYTTIFVSQHVHPNGARRKGVLLADTGL